MTVQVRNIWGVIWRHFCISIFMCEVGMIVTVSVFCSTPSAVRDIHPVPMPCDRHNPATDTSHGFEIAIQ